MKKNDAFLNQLPVKFDLRILVATSCLVAALAATVSVLGLAYQAILYPTEDLRIAFVPNDIINLAVGVPFLAVSLLLVLRHKLIGLLCWPGALFYFLYAYVPYIIGVPFNFLFLPSVTMFALNVYTLAGLLVAIDAPAAAPRLSRRVPVRLTAVILLALAVLILFRQSVLSIGALVSRTVVTSPELGVWIADISLAVPALLLAGLFLWRKKPAGFVLGGSLLVAYGFLSLALIPVMIALAVMKNTPVDIAGIVIVLVMAALCLVPFAFFVRAAGAKGTDAGMGKGSATIGS